MESRTKFWDQNKYLKVNEFFNRIMYVYVILWKLLERRISSIILDSKIGIIQESGLAFPPPNFKGSSFSPDSNYGVGVYVYVIAMESVRNKNFFNHVGIIQAVGLDLFISNFENDYEFQSIINRILSVLFAD